MSINMGFSRARKCEIGVELCWSFEIEEITENKDDILFIE